MKLRKIKKRKTQKIKIQKGARVLGAGQDGCVFTEDAWPCETDLAGYDPSDPTVVSKIVFKTDNEDKVIDIAKEILKDSQQHIVQKIGTCVPEKYDNSTTDSVKLKQMFDNKAEIDTMASSGDYNACTQLSDNVEEDDLKRYFKSIINKRYTNNLYHYILKYKNDKDICTKILNAVPSFARALHKLTRNPTHKLINMDLHGANIFVQEAPDKSITLGIADFGRCAFTNTHDISDLTEKIYKYVTETYVAYSYGCFPIHVRLFSFIAHTSIIESPEKILENYCNIREFVDDYNNEIDIIYLLERHESESFIRKYLLSFIRHFKKLLINQGVSPSSSRFVPSSIEEDNFIYYVLGETFHTIGFLNVFLNTLMYTREVLNEIPALRNAVREYVVNNNASKFSNTLLHRLVKFYFDLLMYPYRVIGGNNAVDMSKLIDIMKKYDFISDLDKVFKGTETVAASVKVDVTTVSVRSASINKRRSKPVTPRSPSRDLKELRERLQANVHARQTTRAAEIRIKKKTRKYRL
jgi:hypothetical protein